LITSEVNKTNKTDIVKTHGESTALNKTIIDDLQGKQESDISSLAKESESKYVGDSHATDCSSLFQASSGESELRATDTDMETFREVEVKPNHTIGKKTDLTMPKTDASQIIADVVESIEQESTPPVAPPRRRKRKKKADGELQVSIYLATFRQLLSSKWPILLGIKCALVSVTSKMHIVDLSAALTLDKLHFTTLK